MNIKQALQTLVDGQPLTRDEMRSVMTEVMTGAATPTQIGALLVALRIRGETIEEIVGAAEVMRSLVTRVHADQERLIDLVGTGGDGANLFNVSTAATFVVAAAGARVAVTGAGPGVFRATAIEAALDANWSPESAGKASVSANGLNSDMHGSAAYRAHLISVMAADAVRAAG